MANIFRKTRFFSGTLMTMEHTRRYPILTIACGPTNSIRGARPSIR